MFSAAMPADATPVSFSWGTAGSVNNADSTIYDIQDKTYAAALPMATLTQDATMKWDNDGAGDADWADKLGIF